MSKFGFLKRRQIQQGQAGWRWMPLKDLGDSSTALLLAPATADNREFTNAALLEGESGNEEEIKKLTASERLDRAREIDRRLLLTTLLKGWRGMHEYDEATGEVVLKDGKPVEIEFTPEHAREFAEKCPPWILDQIKAWCQNPRNFIDPLRSAPRVDGHDLGKE